jgi:GGDEF domain-containing protein
MLPTMSPGRLVVALTLVLLGVAGAALAVSTQAELLWLSLPLLGLVAATGMAQLFPWSAVGLALATGLGIFGLVPPANGAAPPSWPVAGPTIFFAVGLLAELAGRGLVRGERALALGEEPHPWRREPDGLHGSHARADRTLAEELARARRYRFKVTLALLEISEWQILLSDRGRAGMLQVVREFGEELRQSLRRQDRLSYVGGGRFTLILPHTDTDGAVATVERATEILRREFGMPLRIGLAEFPDDGSTEEELVGEAEAALGAGFAPASEDTGEAGLVPSAVAGDMNHARLGDGPSVARSEVHEAD